MSTRRGHNAIPGRQGFQRVTGTAPQQTLEPVEPAEAVDIHADYRAADLTPIDPTELAAGTVVWIDHPDGHNPWRQLVHVVSVEPCSDGRTCYATVAAVGRDRRTHSLRNDPWGERRWVRPGTVYATRQPVEVVADS